jgi:hypothetical protein
MDGLKGFAITALAAIGVFALFEWWSKNQRSPGGPNPVAQEQSGVIDTNFSSGNQMTSGVPEFNSAAIANGHGDQVSAARHSNRYSMLNGSSNYEPAFGPSTNGGSGVTNGRL